MSPRKAAEPKPPKPWRREEAGTYRSADDRFELAGDGAGRWFVRDQAETDELGLPRTTGPFATLAQAKDAADAQRAAGAPASPLAGKLDAARSRPRRVDGAKAAATLKTAKAPQPGKPPPKPSTGQPGKPPPKPSTGQPGKPPPRAPASGSDEPASGPKPRPNAAKRPASPKPAPRPAPPTPTWLDELARRDSAAARRAGAEVRALEERGVDGAETLVRRDRLGGRPAVAERLLLLAIRARVAEALTDAPGSPEERAAIATRVIAAVLEAISRGETGRSLPTWELVEGETGRRLRPDPSDNA